MNAGTRNILAIWHLATTNERDYGCEWYIRANRIARKIALDANVPLDVAAAVLSALSPQNTWDNNVQDAERLVQAFKSGAPASSVNVRTYNANKRKAWAILSGDLSPSEAFSKPTSLKTRAFFHNILTPFSSASNVVVDGHAWAIWTGERTVLSKVGRISPATYAAICSDYAEAARILRSQEEDFFSPSQVQAVTWLAWRALHNVLRNHSPQFSLDLGVRPGQDSDIPETERRARRSVPAHLAASEFGPDAPVVLADVLDLPF